MPYFDQSQFEIRCEWGSHGISSLAGCNVIVVVDVLSFTTSVEIAVSRDATVFPYPLGQDGVEEYAAERDADVAVKRSTQPGQLSLSPASLAGVAPGKRLVLPSPNGSALSVQAGDTGATVLAGCMRNATAVARIASQVGGSIGVVPAGERWPDRSLRPSLEDAIGAGAILAKLPANRSPEAQACVAAFDDARPQLHERLSQCSSGRELMERGFERDVALAAELDVSESVPTLDGDAFRPFA